MILNLDEIAGLLIGAKSTRFKMFHKLRPETKQDANQWMFISLVSTSGVTYDFKFTKF